MRTVIHVITKLELGGAQQNTLDTCSLLDRRRFRVALLSGPDGLLTSEAARIPDIDYRIVPSLSRPIRPVRDYHAFRCLRDHIRQIAAENGPPIVHTHSSKGGILGRLAARAADVSDVVHTIHGFGHPACSNLVTRQLALQAERHVSQHTRCFVAVSKANLERGRSLNLFRNSRVELIRSGFDLGRFRARIVDRAEARQRLGLEPESPLIGTVACFKPQKDLQTFVKTAGAMRSAIPDARFLIVGDGDSRPDLERMIGAAGLRPAFSLLGWRRDVPEILPALDVFVLTSRWEGLPRSLVQAMACGIPVVSTSVDGVLDLVTHMETGLLARPGDHLGIARGISDLIRDEGLRHRLAANAAPLVDQFDLGTMIAKLEALYESLAG
ncbi:MAG: glycosyltransferase family 4 protein [Planctomycetota bacterium]